MGMGDSFDMLHRALRFSGEVLAETLWPTRCALCDAPGAVLCDVCARKLPFLDWWKACPRCGAAYGRVQCDVCNPVGLGRLGRTSLPFEGCASATMFSEATGSLVRVYKDQGERRLAGELAARMQRVIAPAWRFDAVTFVPATKAAVRTRGFDHAELLAQCLAERLGASCECAFDRPRIRDQRKLTGYQRVKNLDGAFAAFPVVAKDRRFLLVDDVMTTGSTLCAATDALVAAGASLVYCVTFARV